MSRDNRRNSTHKVSQKHFPLWGWFLSILLLVAAVSAVFLTQLNPRSATERTLPPEISVAEAKKLFDKGTFLLDVRTPEEWDEIHIEGAAFIPLDELPKRLSEVPQDQPVMVICRSGNRSQTGRDILKNAGYQQVTSIAGGIREWSAAGFPTINR